MPWNYPTTIWFGARKIEDLANACLNLKIKLVNADNSTKAIVREVKMPIATFFNLIINLKTYH